MGPSIDVVVPACNHYPLTDDCLTHLRRQSVPHRVIVVDDGSSDGTPELLRGDWPEVTVLELGANHGYTTAINRGVGEGDGEYVVLLNNDVQLRPDCLERLIAPMTADVGVGSVAALMLRPGEDTIDSFGVTADVTLAGFARLQGHPVSRAAQADTHTPPVLTGPEGTAGAYRRSAWEQVGGLDQTIVAYMEILDLALRLRTAGWSTAGAPDALGVHLGSATYGRRSSRQRRLAGFSRGYLIRRYDVLRSRAAWRTLATETIVIALDLLTCHDRQALCGRVQGWRAASGCRPHAPPPAEAIDSSITFWQSLMLRRGAPRPTGG